MISKQRGTSAILRTAIRTTKMKLKWRMATKMNPRLHILKKNKVIWVRLQVKCTSIFRQKKKQDSNILLNETNIRHELFKARETDAHFPDEVEYPPNTPARTRFARYRALKNFSSSPWDLDEPEDDHAPTEWSRLVRFGNWRATCSRIDHETSHSTGVKPGVRVQIYLRACPKGIIHQPPRALYSLLRHENKFTTLNFTITPISNDDENDDTPVIKSKDV